MATIAPRKAPCSGARTRAAAVSARQSLVPVQAGEAAGRRSAAGGCVWPAARDRVACGTHALALQLPSTAPRAAPCLRRARANQLGPQPRQHGKQSRLQQAAQQRNVPNLPAGAGQSEVVVCVCFCQCLTPWGVVSPWGPRAAGRQHRSGSVGSSGTGAISPSAARQAAGADARSGGRQQRRAPPTASRAARPDWLLAPGRAAGLEFSPTLTARSLVRENSKPRVKSSSCTPSCATDWTCSQSGGAEAGQGWVGKLVGGRPQGGGLDGGVPGMPRRSWLLSHRPKAAQSVAASCPQGANGAAAAAPASARPTCTISLISLSPPGPTSEPAMK